MILYFVIYSNCIQTTDNLHWDAFRALRITAPPPMSAYIRGRQRGWSRRAASLYSRLAGQGETHDGQGLEDAGGPPQLHLWLPGARQNVTPWVRHDLKTYTGSTDVNTTLVFSVSERRRMDTSRNDWLNGIYFIAINTAQRTLLWVRIYYTETFCCISSHHVCRHRPTRPKNKSRWNENDEASKMWSNWKCL